MIRTLPAALAALGFSAAPALADWSASPQSMGVAEQAGQAYSWDCPPVAEISRTIWGAGLYTSDSSVCVAAAHSGHINTLGGLVIFQITEGADSYPGATANGITSSAYGAWPHAFMITGAEPNPPGSVAPPQTGGPRQIGWSESLVNLGIDASTPGEVHRFLCPPGGSVTTTIWGTGIYSSDSAVCGAAVHVGRITAAEGGPVTIITTGPQMAFQGATMNGITSSEYGQWGASYSFQ